MISQVVTTVSEPTYVCITKLGLDHGLRSYGTNHVEAPGKRSLHPGEQARAFSLPFFLFCQVKRRFAAMGQRWQFPHTEKLAASSAGTLCSTWGKGERRPTGFEWRLFFLSRGHAHMCGSSQVSRRLGHRQERTKTHALAGPCAVLLSKHDWAWACVEGVRSGQGCDEYHRSCHWSSHLMFRAVQGCCVTPLG